MRELLILDRELQGSKGATVFRRDLSLYQRSLATEAAPVLREAEACAKTKRLGRVTLVVVVRD